MKTIARESARILFDRLPWPKVSDENWRRTDLDRLLPSGALDRAAETPSPPESGIQPKKQPESALKPNFTAVIETRNGIPQSISLSAEAKEAGLCAEFVRAENLPAAWQAMAHREMDASGDRITAWHYRECPGALIIGLNKNARIDDAVLIREQCGSHPVSAPHLYVKAHPGSKMRVLWNLEAAEGNETPSIVNAGLSADADAARIRIALRQNLPTGAALFLHDHLIARENARIDFIETHLGAGLVKTRARAVLCGVQAQIQLDGIVMAADNQHMDIGSIQQHEAPDTRSNALYKHCVRSGAYSIYQGLITVAPEASGTDAYLANNNLLLDDGARADSLPQLDIRTDEVKCSHGSATGGLNEAQLFYLASRGYSPDEAALELAYSFLSAPLQSLPESIGEILAADIESSLTRQAGAP